MSCSLAVGLLGAAHPQTSLEDEIPDLKSARQGARERLGHPECQAVLTDFESVNGGRLDQVLRASGRTAQEQLDRLELESGLGRSDCERGPVMAFTTVHSTSVLVCLQHFRTIRPGQQEAVLIHEMLHSLGLGENPPTSMAITEQILSRCGN